MTKLNKQIKNKWENKQISSDFDAYVDSAQSFQGQNEELTTKGTSQNQKAVLTSKGSADRVKNESDEFWGMIDLMHVDEDFVSNGDESSVVNVCVDQVSDLVQSEPKPIEIVKEEVDMELSDGDTPVNTFQIPTRKRTLTMSERGDKKVKKFSLEMMLDNRLDEIDKIVEGYLVDHRSAECKPIGVLVGDIANLLPAPRCVDLAFASFARAIHNSSKPKNGRWTFGADYNMPMEWIHRKDANQIARYVKQFDKIKTQVFRVWNNKNVNDLVCWSLHRFWISAMQFVDCVEHMQADVVQFLAWVIVVRYINEVMVVNRTGEYARRENMQSNGLEDYQMCSDLADDLVRMLSCPGMIQSYEDQWKGFMYGHIRKNIKYIFDLLWADLYEEELTLNTAVYMDYLLQVGKIHSECYYGWMEWQQKIARDAHNSKNEYLERTVRENVSQSMWDELQINTTFAGDFVDRVRSNVGKTDHEVRRLDAALEGVGLARDATTYKRFDYKLFKQIFNYFVSRVKRNARDRGLKHLKDECIYAIRFRSKRYMDLPGYYVLETGIGRWMREIAEKMKPELLEWRCARMKAFYDEDITDYTVNGLFGSDMEELARNGSEFMSEARDFLGTAKEKLDIVETDMRDFQREATKFMQSFTTSFGLCEIGLSLGKIFSYFYLVSQKANRTVTNIAALTLLAVPVGLAHVEDFVGALSRAVTGVLKRFGCKVGGSDEERLSEDREDDIDEAKTLVANGPYDSKDRINDDSGIIVALFKLLRFNVTSMFGSASKIDVDNIKLSMEKVQILSRTLSACKTVFNFFTTLLQGVMKLLYGAMLRWYGIVPAALRSEELAEIINEFVDMKLNGDFDMCKTRLVSATRVKSLRERTIRLEGKISAEMTADTLKRYTVMPYLAYVRRELDEIWKMVPPQMQGDANRGRPRPFCVWLHGRSGVGKSSVVQPYIINSIAQAAGVIEEFDDPDNYSFFREMGRNFWDGYANQPVVQYNDIFQTVADDQYLHNAIREFTSINDDIIFPLDMAFGDKGRVYFTSPIVVVNAQADIVEADFLNSKSWSKGTHLLRRRHLVVELVLNPKYIKNGVMDNEMMLKEINRLYDGGEVDKLIGDPNDPLFPADMYAMRFTDPIKGSEIAFVNFEAGMEIIRTEAANVVKHGVHLKEKLMKSMEYVWNKRQSEEVRTTTVTTTKGEVRSTSDLLAKFKSSASPSFAYTPPPAVNNPPPRRPAQRNRVNWRANMDDGTSLKVERSSGLDRLEVNARSLISRMWRAGVRDEGHEDDDFKSTVEPDVFSCGCVQECLRLRERGTFRPEDIDNAIDNHFMVEHEHIGCGDTAFEVFQYMYSRYSLTETTVQNKWEKWRSQALKTLDGMVTNLTNLVKTHPILTMLGAIMTGLTAIGAYRGIQRLLGMHNYPQKHAELIAEASSSTDFDDNSRPIDTLVEDPDDMLINTSEGNIRPTKRKIKRVLAQRSPLIANGYNQTNVDLENVLISHYALMNAEVLTDDVYLDVKMTGVVLCLGADIFVSPRHYWHKYMQYAAKYHKDVFPNGVGEMSVKECLSLIQKARVNTDKFRIKLSWGSNKTLVVKWDTIDLYEPPWEHAVDLVYFRIRNHCNMSSLSKFFVSETDDFNMAGAYLWGPRAKNMRATEPFCMTAIPVMKMRRAGVAYHSPGLREPVNGEEIFGHEYKVAKVYRYSDSLAAEGDCGMVLVHLDAKLSSRKLLGIHIAGSKSTNDGAAAMIFSEDLKEVLAHFRKKENIIAPNVSEQVDYSRVPDDRVTEILLANGLEVLGSIKPKIHPITGRLCKMNAMLPMKSCIQPTLVKQAMEDEYGPTIFEPARLRPFLDGEELVSPLNNAIKKLSAFSQMFDQVAVDVIKDHISGSINSLASVYNDGNSRLLTEKEIINGWGMLKPIDMSTSAGFPFVQFGMKKVDLFEYDKNTGLYRMGDYLRMQVNEMEERMFQGEVPDIIWCDSLKDETRPIGKTTKPRIFEVGPVTHLILMRKYFGYWVSHMYSTFIEGECSVGVNANSADWTWLLNDINEVGDSYLNGDYKWYDSTLMHQMARVLVEVAHSFYNDEWYQLRHALVLAAMFSLHLIGETVFLIRQGNPSGWFLTTIINVICNMFFSRYVYYSCVSADLSKYDEEVRGKFYGDDNFIGVCEVITDKYNMFTYQKTLAKYGIEYTSADKKEIKKGTFSLDECTYLKRGFKWDETVREYLAPLDFDVITHIPRWAEGDPTDMNDQLNRFNSALYEMSNHGEDQFNRMRRLFVSLATRLAQNGYDIKPTSLVSYDWCRYNMRPGKLIPCGPMKAIESWSSQGLEDGVQMNDSWFWAIWVTIISYLLSKITTFGISIFDECVDMGMRYVERRRYNVKQRRRRSDWAAQGLEVSDNTGVAVAEQPDSSVEEPGFKFLDRATNDGNLETAFDPYFENPAPRFDLEEILCRPIVTDVFTWAATDTRSSRLKTIDLPDRLYSWPAVLQRVSGAYAWAPDFEVTVRLNGTPMHYGRLHMWGLPLPSGIPIEYNAYYSHYSVPWKAISATGQSETTMRFPFKSFMKAHPLGNDADTKDRYRLWKVNIAVEVPLRGLTGTAASISGSVFVRIVKHRLEGYSNTFKNSTTDDMVANGLEGDNANKRDNVIPSGGNIVRFFRVIGNVGAFVTRTALDLARTLASVGFSVPNVTRMPSLIWGRNASTMKVNEAVPRVMMGAYHDMSLQRDFDMCCGEPGDMDLLSYIQTYGYVGMYNINSTDAKDTSIFSLILSPGNIKFVDGDNIYLSPLAYASTCFDYWRGSIRFVFSFVASSFHTCRIRVAFEPNSTIGDVPAWTLDNLMNIIFDVSGDSELAIVVPYYNLREWTPCSQAREGWGMGKLYVSIVNVLTSGATTVNPISMLVYASAGADFQFASPSNERIPTIEAPTEFVSNGLETTMASFDSEEMKKMDCISINKNPKGVVDGGRFMSDCVTSIKQLLNMTSLIYTNKVTTDPLAVGFSTGGGCDVGAITAAKNFLNHWTRVFRFNRGGLRVQAYVEEPRQVSVSVVTSQVNSQNLWFQEYKDSVSPWDDNVKGIRHFYNPGDPIEFEIPDHQTYRCHRMWNGKPTNWRVIGEQQSVAIVYATKFTGTNNNRISFFIAGADDFIIGTRLPIRAFKGVTLEESGIYEIPNDDELEPSSDVEPKELNEFDSFVQSVFNRAKDGILKRN